MMKNINDKRKGLLKLLSEIKEQKATGPDRIPGKYLTECALEIVDAYVLLSKHQ